MNDTIKTIETDSTTAAMPSESQTWITITQLQKRFGIGRTAAYAWAHRLPNDICMRIGAKKLLINESKLIAYLERKGTHITPRPTKTTGRQR